MADVGISFIFKASTAAFTRGVAHANNAVGRLKDSLKSLGAGDFLRGAGLGAVVGLFVRGMSNAADEARRMAGELAAAGKPIDENTAALMRFGDTMDALKKKSFDVFGSVAGFMEKVGMKVGELIYGTEAAADAQKRMGDEAKAAADKIAKSELDKQRKEAEREKGKADQEALRLAQEEAKYQTELAEAKKKLAAFDRETARAKMSDEARLADLNKERLDITKQISALEKFIKDGGELTLTGTQDLLALKNQQLELQKRIAEETEKTTAQEKETTKAAKETKTVLAGIAGIRGSQQFGSASDEALMEQLKRNRAEIMAQGPFRNIGQEFDKARLESENLNIEKELKFRRKLRSDVSSVGMEGARSRFRGDPLAFEDMVQRYAPMGGASMELQSRAIETKRSLAGANQTESLTRISVRGAFVESLQKTNEKLDAIEDALRGVIKAK